MKINEAFDSICSKVQEAIKPQGFSKLNIANANDNEIVSLYANDTTAYAVIFYKDKQRIVLESCAMTDDGPDNEWRSLSTWMFDPETNDQKDAASIANDFVSTLNAPARRKALKQNKKRNRDADGNISPMFLYKRLVGVFPDLKDEISNEENSYSSFREATFAQEFIVPKVNELLSSSNKQLIKKLGAILSAQYKNGDMDCRSIITIVILNGIDSEDREQKISSELDEVLLKAWRHAKHFRGKNVKPEKPRKQSKFQQYAQSLNETR